MEESGAPKVPRRRNARRPPCRVLAFATATAGIRRWPSRHARRSMTGMAHRLFTRLPSLAAPALLACVLAATVARADDPAPVRSPDPGIVLEPPRVVQRATTLPYRLALPHLGRDGLAPIAQDRYATSATAARTASAITIDTTVTASDAATALVQVEVYDAANTRVFEQKWDAAAFTPGQPRTFRTTWDARTAPRGAYVVRVGLFAPGAGWGVLYHWNNAAAHFTIE